MASETLIQFPIFAPSKPSHHRPGNGTATEVRFSRWNNANAEKFIRHERTQKEIEDQIRFQRRFDSALNIASYNYNPAPPTPTFKSTGTPSSPSQSSIPGKKSKYSRNPKPSHPAFKPILRPRKFPVKKLDGIENLEDVSGGGQEKSVANVKIDDKGVTYEFRDAPFVYQYSYTETPKVKPLGLREPLVAPFEPATMGRPWTGRKPLPPSKKKPPEFDSFQLPPPHKKGVKPVQAPGPYLPGSGPKYVRSREEILGEQLTKEEVKVLIESCGKSTRQLNMGRDGLTHNMLDNIHAHWKRRRVCKIKCKGVCTVDMDNVREQLEEKTGGKVIFSRGGVIYLFRGRNYNYKTRPRFPLMLWKPVTPVYPRLIKRVPEGLTLEEASEMRKKGRNLTPICKLAKNGVYCDLAKNVREAFEACELVRINCQGLNGSDYHKIGAKLKDLVPCVLISFEHEHILKWRGRDWKSSLPESETDTEEMQESEYDTADTGPVLEGQAHSLTTSASSDTSEELNTSSCSSDGQYVESEGSREYRKEDAADLTITVPCESPFSAHDSCESERPPSYASCVVDLEGLIDLNYIKKEPDGLDFNLNDTSKVSQGSETGLGIVGDNHSHSDLPLIVPLTSNNLQEASENEIVSSKLPSSISPSTEGVLLLLKQAVESGSAFVLDEKSLEADTVFEKAVALAKSAPPGPVFRHRPKRLATQGCDNQPSDDLEVTETVKASEKEFIFPSRRGTKKSSSNRSMKDIKEEYLNVVPQGSLRVDELAKLLF